MTRGRRVDEILRSGCVVLIMRLIKSWGKVRLIVARRVLIFDGERDLAMGVVDRSISKRKDGIEEICCAEYWS